MVGGALILLALMGAAGAWIFSAVIAHQRGAKRGLKFYFINLAGCIVLIGLLFLFIVVPSLHCNGLLCGIGELIIFLLASGIAFLIWPLILIPVIKNKFETKDQNR
jgi:hypothetical protein